MAVKERKKRDSKISHITPEDVRVLLSEARAGIKDKKRERRSEEPGLTEDARNFVIKF